eukprot:COSAG02_NODE_8549_length_2527_cov_1.095513_4_plen_167_part_00
MYARCMHVPRSRAAKSGPLMAIIIVALLRPGGTAQGLGGGGPVRSNCNQASCVYSFPNVTVSDNAGHLSVNVEYTDICTHVRRVTAYALIVNHICPALARIFTAYALIVNHICQLQLAYASRDMPFVTCDDSAACYVRHRLRFPRVALGRTNLPAANTPSSTLPSK